MYNYLGRCRLLLPVCAALYLFMFLSCNDTLWHLIIIASSLNSFPNVTAFMMLICSKWELRESCSLNYKSISFFLSPFTNLKVIYIEWEYYSYSNERSIVKLYHQGASAVNGEIICIWLAVPTIITVSTACEMLIKMLLLLLLFMIRFKAQIMERWKYLV